MIDFSTLATYARLLSEAAESKNLPLMDTWMENLVPFAPAVKKAFEDSVKAKMMEDKEFASELADFEARTGYQESLLMGEKIA